MIARENIEWQYLYFKIQYIHKFALKTIMYSLNGLFGTGRERQHVTRITRFEWTPYWTTFHFLISKLLTHLNSWRDECVQIVQNDKVS